MRALVYISVWFVVTVTLSTIVLMMMHLLLGSSWEHMLMVVFGIG